MKKHENKDLVRTDIMLRWEQILELKKHSEETGESASSFIRRILDEHRNAKKT
jgi:hypothetical protein